MKTASLYRQINSARTVYLQSRRHVISFCTFNSVWDMCDVYIKTAKQVMSIRPTAGLKQ